MTARAFMATLSTAGREGAALTKSQWIERYGGQFVLDKEQMEVVPCNQELCEDLICHGWRVVPKNPHPPVIVERWVGDRAGLVGEWVEKRMEWDGEKYVEVK